MNNKYPIKQALVTGIVIGVFSIVAFSIADGLNQNRGWGYNPATIRGIIGLVILVILGVGIYTAMQAARRNNNGVLTYKQAFLPGLLTGMVTGIITAICGAVYCTLINPGYAAYMVAEGKKALEAQGLLTNQSVTALQQQFSTGGQIIQALIGQTLCGAIISAIMAIFIRTKK